ncbi:MAG TPA: ABC transporter permease [Devosiaceae bacterium]|jgi:peptide/nickel transport system permease protein
MIAYLLRRVLQVVPVIAIIIVVCFVLVHTAPGDPITFITGESGGTPEFVAQIRAQYGLDQPLYVQLLVYLGQVIRGDLGYSFISRASVVSVIMSRLPATLLLFGTQFVLSIVFGIILGVLSSLKPRSAGDQSVTVLSLIGYAVPPFWLAQMVLLVFSLQMGWFPAQGMQSLRVPAHGFGQVIDIIQHLTLPALTLTVFNLALIARVTRANMVATLGLEFITYARSKGASESTIIWVHALRNAVLPVITVIGLNIRSLIAGAVLTETVFGWPGIGRLTYDSILARDYPVLMGILIMIGLTIVIGNLLTDIAYALVDPRVRYK